MTGGIGEDPEVVATAVEAGGSQPDDLGLRLIEIVDPDIEVHLLGAARRPFGEHMIGCVLEGNPRPVGGIADDDPTGFVLDTLHAQQLLIEPGQRGGVGTIDDKPVPTSDHVVSLAARLTASVH